MNKRWFALLLTPLIPLFMVGGFGSSVIALRGAPLLVVYGE